jgi:hypothetical protein
MACQTHKKILSKFFHLKPVPGFSLKGRFLVFLVYFVFSNFHQKDGFYHEKEQILVYSSPSNAFTDRRGL